MRQRNSDFKKTVLTYYREHGRHDLPWRQTSQAYKVMLSEMMLQQTQVDRVVPKYKAFLKLFPTVEVLATANLAAVLSEWQGLGYNRRAKMLHMCAKQIVENHEGVFPTTYEGLKELPGIGPYTAGAIVAFAYNQAVPVIETNIRTVYLHHYFKDETDVAEADLLEIITDTLDTENPREWYWALMDYGAYLKKTYGNPNSRAKSHVIQSPFEGSDRQIRGAIIRHLSQQPATRLTLHAKLALEDIRIDVQLERLLEEGMIQKQRQTYSLPQ